MGYTLRRSESRKEVLCSELERIIGILRGKDKDIERIILFGSLARDDVGPASDIDLILVQNTDKRFLDRLDEIYRAIEPRVGLDVLVYTPAEFESMKENNSFVRKALSEGRVLYARDSC